MDEKGIEVRMYYPKDGPITRTYNQTILKNKRLGRELKISPKAHATINNPGFSVKFEVETVNVLIGIGNDHTADLLMTVEAWEALNAGEDISTTTLKEFKQKFFK